MIPGRVHRRAPIPGPLTRVHATDSKVRRLLAACYSPSLITQCVGLDARLIRQLEEAIMDETVVSLSELHRIDSFLQFYDPYRDLVSRCIAPTSNRFSDALEKVQNPIEFVISLHGFVRGLIDPGHGCLVR
jgi:hypothetical protein